MSGDAFTGEAARADGFTAYARIVETLLDKMPAIYAGLHPQAPIEDLAGWRSMQMRYQAFRDQGREPVQVAMLFGPSGAGKSTLFRLLTGIDVPAGGEIRPMTYGCAVAAPPPLATAERLSRLFPFYELANLTAPEQLSHKDHPADLLYFAPSHRPSLPNELPLVLVDVPDFNAYHTENWAQAERMLERAEIVLFVVYDEAYSDSRVVANLARACRKASFLAYLFTKTSHAAAEKKWQHLHTVVGQSQAAAEFAERRADGRTVAEFLSAVPVYHSPRSETPSLAEIAPVTPEAPAFESLLLGHDGERIILAGLLESTSQAIHSCQETLSSALALVEDLQSRLNKVQRMMQQTAREISQREFPVLRLLTLAVEESQANERKWLRTIKAPLRWISRASSSVYSGAKEVIKRFSSRENLREVRSLDQLEREALEHQSETLATELRLEFPAEATVDGMLSGPRCAAVRQHLLELPLPEPTTLWETAVRERVRTWCQEHRVSALALSACSDVFAAAAGGIVVLDLFFAGGLGIGGTTLLAGAPTAAVAAVALFVKTLKLQGVAEEALAAWQQQRQAELARHLQTHFADPLVEPWRKRCEALNPQSIAACQEACRQIHTLLAQSVRSTPSNPQSP